MCLTLTLTLTLTLNLTLTLTLTVTLTLTRCVCAPGLGGACCDVVLSGSWATDAFRLGLGLG